MLGLALRYLLARRRQTLFMLLGIILGTMAFIALSGLLIGFKEYLVDQLVNNSASVHIESANEGGTIRDPRSWERRLDSDQGVEAYAPLLSISAIYARNGVSVPGVLLGCDAARQSKVTTIAQYVVAGSFPALLRGGRDLAVGAVLAKKLGVGVGQELELSSVRGRPTRFVVAALFKTGIEQEDSLAYAPLPRVQDLAGAGDRVSEISVRLKDYTRASEVAAAWAGAGTERVESWSQKNANIVDTFKAEDLVRYLSLGAVLLVAGFGIYNVLSMTVVQKRMDIAILRSMGFSQGDIMGLFLWQGLLLGLAGVLVGSAAGLGLSLYLRTVAVGGNPMGSGTGHMAVSLAPAIYLEAALLALLATCLSTVLPARAAGRLDPIEIIRGGAA